MPINAVAAVVVWRSFCNSTLLMLQWNCLVEAAQIAGKNASGDFLWLSGTSFRSHMK